MLSALGILCLVKLNIALKHYCSLKVIYHEPYTTATSPTLAIGTVR